ncbi:hypothetical protein TSUD_375020 [Trifolium subterraneum]|uniref:Uncharacterized protein n=1 Tax=Trifolium subterraneum TaxID=3900 RepID=A0A2Z6N5N1_TRISU|nr:hypothetical protein TSUD_375020 [Trifolium subterraneum]
MARTTVAKRVRGRATIPSDTAPRYMTWYFQISHSYIVRNPARQFVVPVESDVVVLGRLASIRDILNGLIISGEVPNGSYTLTFVPNHGGPGSSS